MSAAFGSATEVEYYLVLARDLGLEGDVLEQLEARNRRIKRMLSKLDAALTERDRRSAASLSRGTAGRTSRADG